MQPFETQSENPKPQTKAIYPTFDAPPQGQNPQPQGQGQNSQPQDENAQQYPQLQGHYPQYQPQGQYPQQYPQPQYPNQYPQQQSQCPQQRPSYPNYQQQRPQQPYPQAPYQQPGGYPNYQAQPQHVMYAQGANQDKNDAHKIMLAHQLSRSRSAGGSGKGFVALYSLSAVVISVAVAYTIMNQTSYQILLQVYEKIVGRSFDPADSFSRDTCQAFLADIIAVPLFLFLFAAFNFMAMLVSLTGLSLCMFIQPLAGLACAGIAIFASQQQCIGYSILNTMFGENNVPQNASPYYVAMAVSSLLSGILNWCWNSNEEKAKVDQRNLALMMAAS